MAMDRNDEARVARTESVFRHVNERIAEASAKESDHTLFVCECADPDCHDRLHVPRDQYEEVRSESTHFIVAEGHDVPKFERVVDKRRGYAVVQKFKRRLATLVRRTDPRAETV
jgi:hypothetical protein